MIAPTNDRAALDALRGGVRGLAEMLGVTDPDATVADVAAAIERLRVAMRSDAERIGRLLAHGDRAQGDVTLARHERDEARRERDHLRRELDTINLNLHVLQGAGDAGRPG